MKNSIKTYLARMDTSFFPRFFKSANQSLDDFNGGILYNVWVKRAFMLVLLATAVIGIVAVI